MSPMFGTLNCMINVSRIENEPQLQDREKQTGSI